MLNRTLDPSNMKSLILSLFALAILQSCTASESIFVLSPTQSMIISGKGPGQDAAINPYLEEDSHAIVRNLGKNSFDVRIQSKGEIIEIVSVLPNEKRVLRLRKGYELYLDCDLEGKARVEFEKHNG